MPREPHAIGGRTGTGGYGTGWMANIRAANRVFQHGRRIYNEVQRIRTDRRRARNVPPGRSAPYKKRKVGRGASGSGGPAADDYYAGSVRRGKVRKQKRKSVVKLKPAMKEAIKRLLAPGDVTGKYTKKVVSSLWFGGTPEFGGSVFDNKQKVEYLGVPFAFTPNSFNEAASILWRNRSEPSSSVPGYDAGVDFQREGLKMVVIDSSCHVTFRNNSKRAYKLKFFVLAPKKVTNIEPKGDLSARLTEMNEGTNSVNNGANVFSVSMEKIGLDPRSIPGWNKTWSVELHDILLQPGQSHIQVVQGPKWLDMDWNKFLNGGDYIEQQKFMRYMMVFYHTDLIASGGVAGSPAAPGQAGYYAEQGDIDTGLFDGFGVLVDQTFHYHLKMPEQVGFQVEGGGPSNGEQSLSKRRYAYAYSDYIAGKIGTLERIDDEAGGALVQN